MIFKYFSIATIFLIFWFFSIDMRWGLSSEIGIQLIQDFIIVIIFISVVIKFIPPSITCRFLILWRVLSTKNIILVEVTEVPEEDSRITRYVTRTDYTNESDVLTLEAAKRHLIKSINDNVIGDNN